MMDTQRLILFFVFGFSLLMLWDAWEKEHRPKPAPQAQVQGPSANTVPDTCRDCRSVVTVSVIRLS